MRLYAVIGTDNKPVSKTGGGGAYYKRKSDAEKHAAYLRGTYKGIFTVKTYELVEVNDDTDGRTD